MVGHRILYRKVSPGGLFEVNIIRGGDFLPVKLRRRRLFQGWSYIQGHRQLSREGTKAAARSSLLAASVRRHKIRGVIRACNTATGRDLQLL